MARAGRAARAGTRAIRIVRVVKLIAVMIKERNKRKHGDGGEAIIDERQRPSKVGTKLSDLISRKVIVIVGMMLIVSSLLDLIDLNIEATFEQQLFVAEKIHSLLSSSQASAISSTSFADVKLIYDSVLIPLLINFDTKSDIGNSNSSRAEFLSALDLQNGSAPDGVYLSGKSPFCSSRQLRHLRLNGKDIWCDSNNYGDLRIYPNEFIVAASEYDGQIVLDDRTYNRSQSVNNIVQVSIITCVLLFSSLLFSRDADVSLVPFSFPHPFTHRC